MEALYNSALGLSGSLKDRLQAQEASIASASARVDTIDSSWSTTTAQVTSIDSRVVTLEGVSYNQIVYNKSAWSLDQCTGDCKQCVKSHYANFPDYPIYQCVDNHAYGYGKKCSPDNGKWNKDLCMRDPTSYCHESWPLEDVDKRNSPEAVCRTVPTSVIEGNFAYGPACGETDGLCVYGCTGGEYCAWSWEQSDRLKANSPAAMCRCTNFF